MSPRPFCELKKAFYSILSHDTYHQWKWFVLMIFPSFFRIAFLSAKCDRWLAVGVAKFTPKLKVLKYVGEKVHRCSLHKIMYEQVKEKSSSFDVSSSPFDILLTACAIALMVQDFQSQIPWYYAIIDESQRLENPSSVRDATVNHQI
ncbi:hypothetical protein Patl1_07006 [Pistacia atlantica]|uniref:Uncharacterized protein n=1 Tax=Pistacia atlantica TaxID=434234 RepID=A0ACC1AKN1_9ROSI|nr:hypothetical protein Patl1_07006 [Pistacia atlantica]